MLRELVNQMNVNKLYILPISFCSYCIYETRNEREFFFRDRFMFQLSIHTFDVSQMIISENQ